MQQLEALEDTLVIAIVSLSALEDHPNYSKFQLGVHSSFAVVL